MATLNLWPVEVTTDGGIESPTSVLRQQAALLGQMTKNLVEAYVEADTDPKSAATFVDHFILVSPTLNYRYPLFNIRYSARIFPVHIFWNGYSEEMVTDDDGNTDLEDGVKEVSSRNELEKELHRIFSAPRTVMIIQALIARARS